MRPFQAVIFDMDGVLFDSERTMLQCWADAAGAHGFTGMENPYPATIGVNAKRTREIIMEYYGETFPYETIDRERLALFRERYGGGRLPVKSGAAEILSFLKKSGKKIALASSSDREKLLLQLKDSGFSDDFDAIISGDMVLSGKPDPEIFLTAARAIGAEPSETYVIEDSHEGVRAGARGGFHVLMVPDMLPANEEMKSLAEAVLPDLHEAIRYLQGITEFRKVFDTIPEQFDRYRPKYSKELFDALISYAGIGPGKDVLELGPGTGQATDPILATGCNYHAIELGEHLYAKMREKYGKFPNFEIVNDDFITHDFGAQKFDMIYSAATIQWIPEEIAFSKCFSLLKPGGTLAMMMTVGDYKTPDETLYRNIQKVYDAYFKPETSYMHGRFGYLNAPSYGFTEVEKREFHGTRVFTTEEYLAFCGTHCDHIVLPEPWKSSFYDGLRKAVEEGGDRVQFNDTYVLYLTKKPL